jgi:redox-sensitive bicupin YhaK (pirin superfamily)
MGQQNLYNIKRLRMSKTRKIRRIVTGSHQVDGAGVKLVRVVGRADIEDFDPFLMLDVAVEPGFKWRLPVDSSSALFIYIVKGGGFFDTSFTQVESHRAVLFVEGDEFAVQAGPGGIRFVLFAGRPLREPIAWGGPIVMNTQEELQQAFADMDNGTFIRAPKTGEGF